MTNTTEMPPDTALPPPALSFKAGLKRSALLAAARLFPAYTAQRLAHRYLCSSHGFLDELEHRRNPFDVLHLGPDLAILRHPRAVAHSRRILIVPGHDGHYRQFTRLLRSLTKANLAVDMLVMPGHVHSDQTKCSIKDMVGAIQRAVADQGPYDGLVAHCVSANAALFALQDGMTCPRIALISTPLDLWRLVRFGGAQYGLTGHRLDRFVEAVNSLSLPYRLDAPWAPLAAQRREHILAVHASDDYAAPVEDIRKFQTIAPNAEVEIYDQTGHNAILNSKAAVARVTDFMAQ